MISFEIPDEHWNMKGIFCCQSLPWDKAPHFAERGLKQAAKNEIVSYGYFYL
jgi:hypothetical protein